MSARGAVFVVLLLVPLAVPAAADAAFAQRTDDGVLEVSGGSERNSLTVSLSGDEYQVSDGAGMRAGSGCTRVNATTARCSTAQVRQFLAKLGGGNDEFSGTAEGHVLFVKGGGGADSLTGGPGAEDFDGGDGDDTVAGGDGYDALEGGAGNDIVSGGEGGDGVAGGPGNDDLSGGPGNDTLDPGAGPGGPSAPDSDTLSGGEGDSDQVPYFQRWTSVTVTIDGVANDGGVDERDNVRTDVEVVSGGFVDDELRGGPGDERLYGGWGSDLLDGGGGHDTVDGSDGDDKVRGGAGSDAVYGGLGDDTVDGGAPGLRRGDKGDVLDGGPGADDISGGAGVDAVSYASATGPVVVTLNGRPGDGPRDEGDNIERDVEHVLSGAGADRLRGTTADNTLESGGGDDHVNGGGGNDTIFMGAGSDVTRTRDGLADDVHCGPGEDVAFVDARDTVAGCERVYRNG